MSGESELLPCPFCGGVAHFIGDEGKGYNVQCKSCLATGGWGDYGYQASAAWNRRVQPGEALRVEPIHEAMDEGDGFWTACSGCQESVEGVVSKKLWPYSEAFRCQPGAGCGECGGLGVLWTTQTTAKSLKMKRPPSPPPAPEGLGEWCDATKTLPDRGEHVWCRNRDGRHFEGCICYGMHKPFFTIPHGDGNPSNTAPAWIDVTHWMPLPIAPTLSTHGDGA